MGSLYCSPSSNADVVLRHYCINLGVVEVHLAGRKQKRMRSLDGGPGFSISHLLECLAATQLRGRTHALMPSGNLRIAGILCHASNLKNTKAFDCVARLLQVDEARVEWESLVPDILSESGHIVHHVDRRQAGSGATFSSTRSRC